MGCNHCVKRSQLEALKDLARFIKKYTPRYGYKYLCTVDDDYKYFQPLDLNLSTTDFSSNRIMGCC